MNKFPLLILLLAVSGCETPGEGRHERHSRVAEASAKATPVSGGSSLEISKPYAEVYEGVITFLKKQDYLIETANKETGQIVTALAIEGGWRQTGTRAQITLIAEPSYITVKVVVSEQKRYKALQIDPWSEPKANTEASSALAEKLKANF